MQLVGNGRRLSDTIPLKTAVLCVDCESVSGMRVDKCPVCGSASVFSIAPMLGGSLAEYESERSRQSAVAFNVAIRIDLSGIEGAEVNTVLSDITALVGFKLGRTQASLHIDVEPVACSESALKAA